jgi:hypothetical protein
MDWHLEAGCTSLAKASDNSIQAVDIVCKRKEKRQSLRKGAR